MDVAAEPSPEHPDELAAGGPPERVIQRFTGPISYEERMATEHPIGVVVPFDFALDWEYWRYLPPGVVLHFTRTPHLRKDAGMYLARAVGRPSVVARATRTLLSVEPRSVLYACTSGSYIAGVEGERAIRAAMRSTGCPNPVTSSGAAVAAMRLAGARRIAVATPYSGALTRNLVNFLDESGFEVVDAHYLGLHRGIAAVSQSTIRDFVCRTKGSGAEAVFVSCTSLRTYGIVSSIEAELGVPVFTSNQASLWAVLAAAGVIPRPKSGPEPEWVLGGGDDPVARSTHLLMDAAAEFAATVGSDLEPEQPSEPLLGPLGAEEA